MSQIDFIKFADSDKNNESPNTIFLELLKKIIHNANSDNVLHVTQRNNSK